MVVQYSSFFSIVVVQVKSVGTKKYLEKGKKLFFSCFDLSVKVVL